MNTSVIESLQKTIFAGFNRHCVRLHGGKECVFGHEFPSMSQQVAEDGKGFPRQLQFLFALPQSCASQVETIRAKVQYMTFLPWRIRRWPTSFDLSHVKMLASG